MKKGKGWIYPYIQENKKLIMITVILGLLTVLSAALLMFTSGYLISKSATKPETILMVYVPIVAVRALSIFRAVSRYVERLMGHNVILNILSKMRLRLYKIIEPKVLVMESKFRTGDVLGVLADDIEHIQDIYLKTIFPYIVGFFLYLLSMLALGSFSLEMAGWVGLYLFVSVVLIPLLSLVATKRKIILIKQGKKALYQVLTDAVLGISDWVFSGRQEDFIEAYEQKERELLLIERKRRGFNRLRNFISQHMVAGLVLIIIFWAADQSELGFLPVTFIAAFVLIVFPLTEVFLPLSDAVSQLPRYQNSLERLKSFSNNRQSENQASKGSTYTEEIERIAAAKDVKLEFEHVTFTYQSGKTALDDVSFTLKQGEKLVLLGPSGSGKSTILKLIQGIFVPDSGKVNFNGVSASHFAKDRSKVISVLNQNPHLFDTTILNNIRLGNLNATDEEVYWAAKQVKLYDYIQSLPQGFETQLHESGMRLSGGERQRIALARILLQNNPLVILDEPTIGLDPRTERDLLENMFHVLRGKSILFITHHLAGIKQDDRILFVDNGNLIMNGTHRQLLSENERYVKLNA
ncbi:thiol reductant ABC exporter subunit CydC [Mesobacillus maritimus]|uniref:thiol reductant ABC exporter subunit CydC n=1 Tax=Mesobacillus maritimus TaxID=1643336 RepID=UPI003850A91F